MKKLSEKQRDKKELRADYRILLLLAQNFRCKLCKGQSDWRGWQLSHILPLSLGGKDELTNLEMLCAKCHAEKRHHLRESKDE